MIVAEDVTASLDSHDAVNASMAYTGSGENLEG